MYRMASQVKALVTLLLLIALNGHLITASAHGVVVWAEVVQEQVRVEVFLTDGERLRQGRVQVLDGDGRQLLEGKLDEQGLFTFPTPQQDEVLIKVNQGHGHSGDFKLKIE